MDKRKVLVCPLDWGIGHATRCVPVIRMFTEQGCEVVLAADGRPLAFLRKEFPDLRYMRLKGTKILYSGGSGMILSMLRVVPRFLYRIRKEHQDLEKILGAEAFDIIVSDNRYGLYTGKARSVIITHQLNIMVPPPLGFITGLIRWKVRRLVARFDECWIPDFGMHFSLAGTLSHPGKLPRNTYYIGPLSRFAPGKDLPSVPSEPVIDMLVMLSGPEPQRTLFEEILFRQLERSELRTIVVRGKTEKNGVFHLRENIVVYDHLDTGSLAGAIRSSYLILSRPGYSTLMDIVTLGKRAIFVPTPGQTEQEYLASYLMKKKIFFSMDQPHFDLAYALEMSVNYPGMVLTNDYEVLRQRISELTGK